MQKTKFLFISVLFIAAFMERVVFDLGPNVELVTATMILSSFYFGSKESFWLTFAIVATSDLIIGNSNIFLFTWTGFLIPALLSASLIRKLNTKYHILNTKKIFAGFVLSATGVSANIFFFLWTNFGVWLLGNMYSGNLSGLLMSYINGLPFLKNQVAGTIIFTPFFFFLIEQVPKFAEKIKFKSGLGFSTK